MGLVELPQLIATSLDKTFDADNIVITDVARPLWLSALAIRNQQAVLAIVPDEAEARDLFQATSEFCPASFLPGWDVLPYEALTPAPNISANRIEALRSLRFGQGARVIVASVRGLIQKPAPATNSFEPIEISVGDKLSIPSLIEALVDASYERSDLADDPGKFAVRGGIVDIFGASATNPVRAIVDFDEVETLRTFNPQSQLSTGDIDRAVFEPTSEYALTNELRTRAAAIAKSLWDVDYYERARDVLERVAEGLRPAGYESVLPFTFDASKDSLGAVVGRDTRVIMFDPLRTTDEARSAVEQEEQLAALWATAALPEADPSLRDSSFVRDESLVIYRPLEDVLSELPTASTTASAFDDEESATVEVRPWEAGTSPARLLERCRDLDSKGIRLVFCASAGEEANVKARLVEESLGSCEVITSQLMGGFITETFAVITNHEWHARHTTKPKTLRPRRRSLENLTEGDFLVHVQHGIGRYAGMQTREVGGFTREYLVVDYAKGDRLFVPSETSDALQRYVGSESPTLSRLGSGDWERLKTRAKRKARDIAGELVKLYAERMNSIGFAFDTDSVWLRELAESFPFTETEGQLEAINDVLSDMTTSRPMDRLVVGDVGFGKTEVAIRSAFTAVVNGKQVAVLVPTTILASQHFATFTERLKDFPVKIALLSRFASPSEQAVAIAEAAIGNVDVLIGTHRLLSKDVSFKDLGLIIVDEEHRFGVAQKEKLKALRASVDVLTLTATPIPRTLEMSLGGIRDLSTIETPPAERRPIRTFVGPMEERLVVAAIRREIARGGQVFYVHNRVRTLGKELRRLERLIPQARIGMAHGQMSPDDLEIKMLEFVNRDLDVLLCTTIIEAGLDIPSSNTLLVDRADAMGLAQLHQLRGRVGRSGEQAYAYLFFPANVRLTPTAHERLKALAQFTGLGSGMSLAHKDLEIRGAGNLLGSEQSGHIEAVGFELYMRLLEQAAKELKGEPTTTVAEVRIDIGVNAYLPTTYIQSEALRLSAYRLIASAITAADVNSARQELIDRYGPLPSEAHALLEVAELKASLRRANITECALVSHGLYGPSVRFSPFMIREPWQQVRIQREYPRAVLTDATSTFIVPTPLSGLELIGWLEKLLHDLTIDEKVGV